MASNFDTWAAGLVDRPRHLTQADRLIGAGFSTNGERPSLKFSNGACKKTVLGLGIH